jgi:VanZ family protein
MNRYFLWAGAWLALVTYLSTMPSVALPKFDLFSADKIAHLGVYAILAALLVAAWRVYRNGRLSGRATWGIIGATAAYGALMEWVQLTFFPGRMAELDDMIANAVGALLGAGVVGWVPFFQKK